MAKPVTADAMKEFAKEFTKNEWITLCNDKDFMRLLPEDLKKARLRANKLLGRAVSTGS